ncbi:5758_t:CDS:2, partial [Scutellospora calospora]
YIKHSKQCKTSQPQRDPPYKLLPYIKKNVETLLNLNVSTADILAQNAKMVKNCINIKNDPAKNLEQFLGPDANPSELKKACLHYQPYTKETGHLEIIISTHEQQEFAWKYRHHNLILMDGTFGISKNKLLLFIILVIDENNKGITISFIIFIPPPQNRLTLSGYDSSILEWLLTIFRDRISTIYNQNHLTENPNTTTITFSPLVAMTDTDVKERKSLLKVWPNITLLLCYFHISQCWKNEMNKQLGRGGGNDTILQRQTLKTYLRNVLKEAWTIDGNENIAAKLLGISFEKLPTTNNHLEGLNEYLKNNQISRFQRNNRLLRADVLYTVLVNEIIPNILSLRNLVKNLEQEKAERRKEFNIIKQLDHKVLQQEFFKVAYLAPSLKRDESAKKLLQTKKVIKYEIEQITGKIFVQVESETTPHLVYTTCVYGQATDICCQCIDFLQRGIMCKHLRAATLYIDELRQQEQHAHLPELTFATYQKAQSISRNLYTNQQEIPISYTNNSDISDDDNSDKSDTNNENEDTDNECNDQVYDTNNFTFTTSEKTLNYMKHILGIQHTLMTISSASSPSQTQFRSNTSNIASLNASAIYKQEFQDFLISTSRSLQALQENLKVLEHLSPFKQPLTQEVPEQMSTNNQYILLNHLHNIVTSESFRNAQQFVDVMHENVNSQKRKAPITSLLPLEQETKRRRHPTYKSY